MRLWLDGKLVVDDWSAHPLRYKGEKLTLRKGQKVTVKLDYYNGTGARGLRLAWKTPDMLAGTVAAVNDAIETQLPAGANWYDFWTNERFTGGQKVSKACPLDVFPLYVRAGSIIPMSPVMNYVTEKPDAPYELRVYPGADATFTIYEDDNETYDYEKGAYATIPVRWNEKTRTLTIGERKGSFPGMVNARQLHVVLAAPGQSQGIAEAATAAGQTVRYTGGEIVLKF